MKIYFTFLRAVGDIQTWISNNDNNEGMSVFGTQSTSTSATRRRAAHRSCVVPKGIGGGGATGRVWKRKPDQGNRNRRRGGIRETAVDESRKRRRQTGQ